MLSILFGLGMAAQAQQYITDIGEPVNLEQGGTWGRAHATADGWVYTYSSQNDYWKADLVQGSGLSDWSLDKSQGVQLTKRGDLVDHGIKRCGDGTWLHAASANVDSPNDSAFAFRYSADFQELASGTLDDRNPDLAHNDLPVVCSSIAEGTGFANMGTEPGNTFMAIDGQAGAGGTQALDKNPRTTGSAFLTDVEEDRLFHIGFGWQEDRAILNEYDADLNLVDTTEVFLLESHYKTYWSQGFIKVGDLYVVATMGRSGGGWNADHGDVWLVVLDRDWNVLERHNTTEHDPSSGGMRPWVSRDGDVLAISYDRDNQHHVVAARIDAAAFGLDLSQPDTGVGGDGGGSGAGGEGSDDAGSSQPTDKGCSVVPVMAPLWLLPMMAARRRSSGS